MWIKGETVCSKKQKIFQNLYKNSVSQHFEWTGPKIYPELEKVKKYLKKWVADFSFFQASRGMGN